jgi:hypothetical protein
MRWPGMSFSIVAETRAVRRHVEKDEKHKTPRDSLGVFSEPAWLILLSKVQSSPTRTRTWNKPVNSLNVQGHNPLSHKVSGNEPCGFARRFAQESKQAPDSPALAPSTDIDLVRIMDAWPTLPDLIRRAILALVSTANG